ncbi:MAG: Gfo/Idh/MocA family oxidoreductase [Proteobacteria bacterium]|nr:Gfo/Idh/MocA family oxidoreductase [Pseudomonadota bacterium]
MSRLRIGVFGAGMVAQVEHVPNLVHLREKFELVAVADPSAKARDFIATRFGVATDPNLDALLARKLDAVLIAAPDFAHVSAVENALKAGLHVLAEKPLCYDPKDAERLAEIQKAAGKVVQVAYMKRFDPSYAAALGLIEGLGAKLRYISVEKSEPDAGYQMGHHFYRASDDVTQEMITQGRAETQRQVTAALGKEISGAVFRGYTGAFCSSLVHDVNLVHGFLDHMGIGRVEASAAHVFAAAEGASATMRVGGDQALWQMVHINVPHLAEYRERVALHFDDRIVELIFPAPYLNHLPTRLILQRSNGHRYETTEIRDGFTEPYIAELEGFHAAVTRGETVKTGIAHAAKDMTLIASIGKLAAA